MNLHKVIVRPGIRTSENFGQLSMLQRDLFYGLLSIGNTKTGWFEANPKILRGLLYSPCLGKVSEREVRDGLLKLREVELIKLWTGRNGRGYGQIVKYAQNFDYGDPLPEDAKPPSDDLFAGPEPPGESPPPAPPRTEKKRSEVSRKAPPAPVTPPTISDDAWLAALASEHPDIDVRAEFRKCEKRYPLGVGRDFFAGEWLPRAERPVRLTETRPVSIVEPEGWRTWLNAEYPDSVYSAGGMHEAKRFAELPSYVQDKFNAREARSA